MSDRQRVDPGALALGGFEIGNPLAAVLLGRPEGIEFVVEGLPDHAALGEFHRWVGRDRLVDQRRHVAEFVEPVVVVAEGGHVGDDLFEVGNNRERRVERAEVAGGGALPRDPPGEAFEIVGLAQSVVEIAARDAVADEPLNRVESRRDLLAVDQRPAKPAVETPPPERGCGLVEHVEDGRARASAAVVEQFEAAERSSIQPELIAVVVPTNPGDVFERAVVALCVLGVGQHRAAGAAFGVVCEAAVGVGDVLAQTVVGDRAVELRGVDLGFHPVAVRSDCRRVAGNQQFVRLDPVEFLAGVAAGVDRRDETLAGRGVDGGDAEFLSFAVSSVAFDDAGDVGRRSCRQQLVFDDRAGRNNAGDRAVDQPAGRLGVLDLLGQCDPVVGVDEGFEI